MKNVLPVWCELSPRKVVHIESAMERKGSLFSHSSFKNCANTIARLVIKARLGAGPLRREQDSINERNAGRDSLESRLGVQIRNKRKGRSAIVYLLDIDRTNQINRRFSYTAGDLVIEKCKEVLETCVSNRTHDLGRCGDDTFFVVIYEVPEVRWGVMKNFADGLVTAISSYSWSKVAYDLTVTCSVGFAEKRDDEDAFDTVIRAAIAMNDAQREGGNRSQLGPLYLPVYGEPKTRRSWSHWS